MIAIQQKIIIFSMFTFYSIWMTYTFMDFCAGIGCGRLGLEQAWFKCVGFAEIDNKAEKTYRTFFGDEEKNYGDLMHINTKKLPDFDILIAWFPCQTFSIVWQRKWMEDPRGQIIFGIQKILRAKNIKYFILENVKGLVHHQWWKTIKNIVKLLDEAWYYVHRKVLNTIDYWLPQSRERVYFLWVRKDLSWSFDVERQFPQKVAKDDIKNYLIETSEKYVFSESRTTTMLRYLNNKYNTWKFTMQDLLKKEWYIIDTRQSDIRFYAWMCPTLRTWRHWLIYSKNWTLRTLSGLEALLLQGVSYKIAKKADRNINNQDLLRQAWNAMSVNVIREIGKECMNFIWNNSPQNDWFENIMISNRNTRISKWIWRYKPIQQLETK